MSHCSNQKRTESFPLHPLEPEWLWPPPFHTVLAPVHGQETNLAATPSHPELWLEREGFAEPGGMVVGCLQD